MFSSLGSCISIRCNYEAFFYISALVDKMTLLVMDFFPPFCLQAEESIALHPRRIVYMYLSVGLLAMCVVVEEHL